MMIYGCGNNISKQLSASSTQILCCPTPVDVKEAQEYHIAFSHILWKTDTTWKLTGHKQCQSLAYERISPEWKVTICENRTAAITESGSVVLWSKDSWRTLFFQTYCTSDLKRHDFSCGNSSDHNKPSQHHDTAISKEFISDAKEEEKEGTTSKGLKIDHSELEGAGFLCRDTCSTKDASIKAKDIPCATDYPEDCDDLELSKTHRSSDSVRTQKYFHKLCLEDNTLAAVDSSNILYCSEIPLMMCRQQVSEIAVGKEHCLALTEGGIIYTWGSGMRGQLGTGELGHSDYPMEVENLDGLIIVSVSCGGWHSAALSDSGDVYVWGWNESGQLGFPYKTKNDNSISGLGKHHCQCHSSLHSNSNKQGMMRGEPDIDYKDIKQQRIDERINLERSQELLNVLASPRLLSFWNEDMNVIQMSCGDRHTLFLLDDGSVWSAGMNKYGQLGLGHTKPSSEPSEIPIKNVIKICAGGWNSIFVTSQ